MSSRFTYFWKQLIPNNFTHSKFDPSWNVEHPSPEHYLMPKEKKFPSPHLRTKQRKPLHHFEEIVG